MNRSTSAETWTYKGLAYSDVPNLVSSFGYINASWTLRADITCDFVCRLLNHMRETGTDYCVPRLRPVRRRHARATVDRRLLVGLHATHDGAMLPRQGDREPWLNTQRYHSDIKFIAKAPVDDDVMQFHKAPARVGSST